MADGGPILVFDSGIGGLSVLRAIRETLPGRRCLYVADDAAFPYGDWEEEALEEHIVELIGLLIDEHKPAAAVIACNTASTLVLPPLREKFDAAFRRHSSRDQAGGRADEERRRRGARHARHHEARLHARPDQELRAIVAMCGWSARRSLPRSPRSACAASSWTAIRSPTQIAPCFAQVGGARTDIVVLACTHYPFLTDIFSELAPWPVTWMDPAPAIARRLSTVIEGRAVARGEDGVAIFTSGRPPPETLARLLGEHGLGYRRIQSGDKKILSPPSETPLHSSSPPFTEGSVAQRKSHGKGGRSATEKLSELLRPGRSRHTSARPALGPVCGLEAAVSQPEGASGAWAAGERKTGIGETARGAVLASRFFRSSSAEKAEAHPALLRRPAPFVCEGEIADMNLGPKGSRERYNATVPSYRCSRFNRLDVSQRPPPIACTSE